MLKILKYYCINLKINKIVPKDIYKIILNYIDTIYDNPYMPNTNNIIDTHKILDKGISLTVKSNKLSKLNIAAEY